MALEESGTGTTWGHERPREDNVTKIRVNASFMTPTLFCTLLVVWGMFDRPIHTFSEIGGSCVVRHMGGIILLGINIGYFSLNCIIFVLCEKMFISLFTQDF
jgi:hypothetical protein